MALSGCWGRVVDALGVGGVVLGVLGPIYWDPMASADVPSPPGLALAPTVDPEILPWGQRISQDRTGTDKGFPTV